MSLLTQDQIMDAFQVKSRDTITRWRKNGCPYIKVGHYVRFEYEKVLDWAKKNTRKRISLED
jgi:hypothetical protein